MMRDKPFDLAFQPIGRPLRYGLGGFASRFGFGPKVIGANVRARFYIFNCSLVIFVIFVLLLSGFCPVSVRFLSDLLSGLLSGLVCVGVIFAIIANSYDSSTLSGFASDHLFGLESG